MKRYVDAEKLIAKIKKLNLVTKTYEEQVAFNNALAMVVEITASLQQDDTQVDKMLCSQVWWEEQGWIMIPPDVTIEGIDSLLKQVRKKLQQEQSEKSKKDCNNCPHCVDRKDQSGWHFKGCFGGPYKGKFIAEIDECPLQQEQPELSNNLVDIDAVREDFMTEVYRVLDADSTNDRANAIINAFDSLPTIQQEQSHFADVGKMEEPGVDLEKAIDAYFDKVGMPVFWCNDAEQRDFCAELARHFYEFGLNARKEDSK